MQSVLSATDLKSRSDRLPQMRDMLICPSVPAHSFPVSYTADHIPAHSVSDGLVSSLAGPHSDCLGHGIDEYLAVTYFAGICSSPYRSYDTVDHLVIYDDLNLDLGDKINGILSPTVNLFVSLLATVPLYLTYGHSLDTDSVEGLLYAVHHMRFDNGFDFVHTVSPLWVQQSIAMLAMEGQIQALDFFLGVNPEFQRLFDNKANQ